MELYGAYKSSLSRHNSTWGQVMQAPKFNNGMLIVHPHFYIVIIKIFFFEVLTRIR